MAINVPYEKLVTCISVIDESSPSVSVHSSDWAAFRNNYPYRTFYLLQPSGGIWPLSALNMPSNYLSDPYANGGIQVNRDDGNAALRSDWFSICNLSVLPSGSVLSLWVDISGSMTFKTVQASYDYFKQRCDNAGIEIVLETSDRGERWIPGHNKPIRPSSNFTIINPGPDNIEGTADDSQVTTIKITSGECVTLSWIIFGDIDTASVLPTVGNITNQVGGYQYVDTAQVCPTSDTTYQLSVEGPAGTSFKTVFVDVLTPPTINLTANPGTSIIKGSCVTLDWETLGDASSITWTSGNITNGNITSSETVCPQDTTTYCAVADGEAGKSPPACITIVVSQPPTATISSPNSIKYKEKLFVNYETKYANVSIKITPIYTYIDGTNSTGNTINITPVASSSELNGTNTVVSAEGFEIPVDWNNKGPSSIQLVLVVSGSGGTKTTSSTTKVIIDQEPTNIIIEESSGKIKDEEPVYTPDTIPDDTILSQLYFIDDIDIPVEIKSNYPIKVSINKSNVWNDVREI